MHHLLEAVFFLSFFGVFHAYFGYPVTLFIVSLFIKRQTEKKAFLPTVTHIIAAYNEEKRIRAKMENALRIDFPADRLQTIVVTDGCTDATDSIVGEFVSDRVRLVSLDARNGKEFAQKEAIAKAVGEIIVFSDVATHLDPGALLEIVTNFSDPAVGCVSSVDKIIADKEEGVAGEGLYVCYEMWMRKLESRVNSLVGLSGSFFAARSELCRNLPVDMDSDFSVLLNAVKAGLRGEINPAAVGYYRNLSDPRKEFTRKLRTVLRGITVFFNNLEFLNCFRYGFFSYQYFSHKLVRWLAPLFLASAFICNTLLLPGSRLFGLLYVLQVLFYASAAVPLVVKLEKYPTLIRIPNFMLVSNAAIAIAWVKFVSGKRIVTWNPSNR